MSDAETTGDLVRRASDLGKQIGAFELRCEVHGWILRHAEELSAQSMRELYAAVGLDKKEPA